jgi:hypothetical protein
MTGHQVTNKINNLVLKTWVSAKKITLQIKEKQSHNMPGEAHRVPGSLGSQISRQSAHEDGRVVSPMHRLP